MSKTEALADRGVSIWLDDLSRERLNSGSLESLIKTRNVVGVTTNPSIFQKAIFAAGPYDSQIKELAMAGADPEEAVRAMTTDDVRAAADIFLPIYEATDGVDGRVSIEVDPRLAHDSENTVTQAIELARLVDRPNVMIKIPATREGLSAITKTLAEGISVNVTSIFSIERYREVIAAFIKGLEEALKAGRDISQIHSVASFFVSRIDSTIDPQLEAIGTDKALALRGKSAVANAQLAWQVFEESFSDEVWEKLAAAGAHKQRPLWASTGVKNPDYPDTLYVDALAYRDCVNTMPEATLEAVADHSDETLYPEASSDAAEIIGHVEKLGISLDKVTDKLETDGVAQFVTAWQSLLDDVAVRLDKVKEEKE
ncbi:transaldolase [Candidatus Saccharibacteria bacterium]|nr:transaldolase [Candidatus Saccharibacteria bacterium]